MVIDTSALIAVLLAEAEAGQFIDAIASDPVKLISAVNALETAIVMEARKGPMGGREFDLLMHKAKVAIVPFDADYIEEARSVWRQFGKGNHPAGLNFCDCCAYALALVSGEALLFKGQDFTRTDIVPAIPATTTERVMKIVLQRTYYQQGFFNVPVEYDRQFGPHNSKVEIVLDDAADPIDAVINRTAQRNGTARILGHAGLRNYFRFQFRPGDSVAVVIESPQRIRLRSAPHY
jgi:ribonuclease VapC